jgi:hypothetical protein
MKMKRIWILIGTAALLLFLAFYIAHPRTALAQGATKRIIVLDEAINPGGTTVSYSTLFWFPIANQPKPQSGSSGSEWVASGTSAGATAAENTAIKNGTILEEANSFSFPVGTPVTAIESVLQQAWTERNAQINGQGANQYYGAYFDGSAWGAQ